MIVASVEMFGKRPYITPDRPLPQCLCSLQFRRIDLPLLATTLAELSRNTEEKRGLKSCWPYSTRRLRIRRRSWTARPPRAARGGRSCPMRPSRSSCPSTPTTPSPWASAMPPCSLMFDPRATSPITRGTVQLMNDKAHVGRNWSMCASLIAELIDVHVFRRSVYTHPAICVVTWDCKFWPFSHLQSE